MLGDYKINRCTRHCHALDRPLKEGEWYYSVILEKNEDYERRDYSAESWTEPPEGAIGWWKKQMPVSGDKKLVLAPPAVLVDLLRQMERFPNKAKSRYLLALMLMRKRIVRPSTPMRSGTESLGTQSLENETTGNQATEDETLEGGTMAQQEPETMVVEVLSDGSRIEIPIATIGKSESETLRDELNELLYCEAEEQHEEESLDAGA